MNVYQAFDKVQGVVDEKGFLRNTVGHFFEKPETERKTVRKFAAVSVSVLALISLLVATITGAKTKPEAFQYMFM